MQSTNALPKTTHALNHDERVRLMRSTRKVGALLGETPLFIDASSPRKSSFPVPAARRPVYIYPATPRSSSLGAYTPGQPQPHASTSRAATRPVLAVRVPSPRDSTDSPLASAASTLTFPRFPTSPEEDERRHRTRKMAKIVRTLGEHIPTELVFPASVPGHVARRRRTSTLSSISEKRSSTMSTSSKRRSNKLVRAPSSAARQAARETLVEEPQLEEWDTDSGDSNSVYSTLSGGDWQRLPKVRQSSSLKGQVQQPPSPFANRASKPSFSSFSESTPPQNAAPPASRSYVPPFSANSNQLQGEEPARADAPVGHDRGTHRSEKGWSGEWVATEGDQMQSMDDVAQRLRGLRLR